MKKDVIFIILVIVFGVVGIVYSNNQKNDDVLVKAKQKRVNRVAAEQPKSEREPRNEDVHVRAGLIKSRVRAEVSSVSAHASSVFDEIDQALVEKNQRQNTELGLDTEQHDAVPSDSKPSSDEVTEFDWYYVYSQWKAIFSSNLTRASAVEDSRPVKECQLEIMFTDNRQEVINFTQSVSFERQSNNLSIQLEGKPQFVIENLRNPESVLRASQELSAICSKIAG